MGENFFETSRDIGSVFLGHRIRQDPGDLRPLIESIRLIGFVQPITVTPSGAVVSGGRRLLAAKALGYRTVDVWVRTDITTDLELLLAEQQENQNRKPYTRIEQARFFDQLRRIFAEDAGLRQQATRFGARDGAPESGTAATRTDGGRRSYASERAALVVTGNRSDYTLGHVVELLHLQEDPSISEPLRKIVDEALARIDDHAPVEPNYLEVKAAQDIEQLELIAANPTTAPAVRQIARGALATLPSSGTPSTVRHAAKQALQRATAAKSAPVAAVVVTGGRRPPATIRTYSWRALTDMVTDLDFWWLHYDPVEVAAALDDDQWDQLTDWVRNTVQFLEAAAAHRTRPTT